MKHHPLDCCYYCKRIASMEIQEVEGWIVKPKPPKDNSDWKWSAICQNCLAIEDIIK